MADGLSFAASIIAVIQLATKVAQLSYEYIRAVKKGPANILRLNGEIKSLTAVLYNLQVFEQENPGIIASWQLGEQLQKCSLDMLSLEKKLEPKKWLPKCLARFQWHFEEREYQSTSHGSEVLNHFSYLL